MKRGGKKAVRRKSRENKVMVSLKNAKECNECSCWNLYRNARIKEEK